MRPYRIHCVVAGSLCLGTGAPTDAAVVFWEVLSYFSAEDSPFYAGIEAGTIYLEDFEDQELNTPNVVSWDFPNSIQEGQVRLGRSVDTDDGLNGDFLGENGVSWGTRNVTNSQALGTMDFRFTPDILGRYPTYVGFVITEALDLFEVFEPVIRNDLGFRDWPEEEYDPLTWYPRNSFPGDTRSHRFFGIYDSRGIRELRLDNIRQLDHLQYGYAIPEPGTMTLFGLGALLGMGLRRRRG